MRTKWAVKKSEGLCLEIGCNLGIMTARLLASRRKIVSGDINSAAVRNVKKFCSSNRKALDLVVFDVCNLPFREKCFDTILLIDVLEHLANPVKAMKEVKRVNVKKILIDVPNYDFAVFLYPNLVPEHFKEPSHLQRTNTALLKSWLGNFSFEKISMHGSYLPLPLPFVGVSYFFEYFFSLLNVKPKRLHFQISCELTLK